MTDTALLEKFDGLAAAVIALSRVMGARLDREAMAQRLGIHRNTLRSRMADPRFPRPGPDGKWLLSEVLEWEMRR